MAATFTPEYEVTEVEVTPADGRRRKITKFALAGVAVLGIGAALTSAAWSDNVWFEGDAESGVVNLRGNANDGLGWLESDDESNIELRIPDFPVAPSQTTTHIVSVQNVGDVPVRLSVDSDGIGAVFTAADTDLDGDDEAPATVSTVGGHGIVLQPGGDVDIEVSVTAPNWEQDQFQNRDGVVIVHVEGSTEL